MEPAKHKILYENGSDRVTSSQAIIGGKTYELSDIDTVSVVAPVLRREYGYGLAIVGLVLLVAGYLVWGTFLTPMFVGVVLIIAGLAIALVVRKSYTVHLNHRDKQTTTIHFPRRAQAEQLVHALTQANKR
ncbi:hypothetical protein SE17_27140 [Kouleothrix aurantiaca]|uniref:QacE n=1 Tax=Kouleothrix aurantiaca TaxID=186479 RepID=A0A0N8PRN3_9CHLR|nr:hypothetical protein SE17_27140 [Kouleothrix aurantiaca]